MDATCVRGFSNTFTPEKKMEVKDLQYIEGDELEITWKNARRQRLKQQEQKIWDEFVKEEDMVHSACKEDPYQFLEQIPETQLKQLLDTELLKMKMETAEEQKRGAGDSPRHESPHAVTFSEVQREDAYTYFDEDHEDKEDDLSIIDDDGLNDTLDSPSTVRERDNPASSREESHMYETAFTTTDQSLPTNETKSSENVANMIEGSIYCAKVKDTRIKIAAELLAMIASLERQNLTSAEGWALRKLCIRAAEYSARFQRIHLYQLQRQLHDIRRHERSALPYAKHTHYQSQLVRIVNLHGNTLQALMVFHKSFEQTSCIRECADQLRALCTVLRDTVEVCKACNMYTDIPAVKELYNDNILNICDQMEKSVTEYVTRINDYISASENVQNSKRSTKSKAKKRNPFLCAQKVSKNKGADPNARLSMYSLDNRLIPKSKGIPKEYLFRRPLMRDPHQGLPPRRPRPRVQETDISTMVENVEPPSSNISPAPSVREYPPRKIRNGAANRSPPYKKTYMTAHTHSGPAARNAVGAPKFSPRKSPKRVSPYITKFSNCNVQSETESHLTSDPITPVSKVQCAKKEPKTEPKTELETDPNTARSEELNKELKIDVGNNGFDDISCEPMLRGNELRNGCDTPRTDRDTPRNDRDTPRNGRDTPRSGREAAISGPESLRSGGESVRSGRDSFRSGRESLRSDRESSRSGHESAMSGNGLRIAVEKRSTSKSKRAGASSRLDKEKKVDSMGCEVTKLLRQLCGGDSMVAKAERQASAKNAQLLFMNANSSPRQPSTPQLLRILEETIQKKVPKYHAKKSKPKDTDKLRLAFNIPSKIVETFFKYRTKYVQHMLASSLYANSAVGKPWEMIGTVSERIIDEILLKCAKELEIDHILSELYQSETQ